tara:strand:- start:63 stop:260 length:198 start_codon:yes stop_codon:yes gene_type:complete
MSIKSAQYKSDTNPVSKKTENTHIELIYEGGEKWQVPLSEDNRHYNEIMEAVAAGIITIAPAEED